MPIRHTCAFYLALDSPSYCPWTHSPHYRCSTIHNHHGAWIPTTRDLPTFLNLPWFCHVSSLSLPWASVGIPFNSLAPHVPLGTSSLPSRLRRSCCPSWASKRSCNSLGLQLEGRGLGCSCISSLGQPSWGYLKPTSHTCNHWCKFLQVARSFHTCNNYPSMVGDARTNSWCWKE